MKPEAPVVQIEQLVKAYPGGGGVHGLDLTIPQGMSFGLLGPNGAGKSTTLKMLMGLIRPDSGTLSILGMDVLTDPEAVRQRVGYVPEYQRMYPWMTVAELLWFVRSFYPTWNDALCAELIRDYGLSGAKRVRELSNGMQTKLALVLALSHQPPLLVLDEPTGGLDPLVREEFLDKVRGLVRLGGRTVLFSSHIMSDIDHVADTVGIMHQGRLLIVEDRHRLMAQTRRISACMEDAGAPRQVPAGTVYEEFAEGRWSVTVHGFSQERVEELQARNRVHDVSVIAPSLEEIFKDFIKGASRA